MPVVDTATRRTIAVLPTGAGDFPTWIAFSPDGEALATARTSGDVYIYGLDAGRRDGRERELGRED